MERIALVTGAGSGVGRAVAHSLLAAEWTVVLAGRSAEPLEATAATSIAPDQAVAIIADVTSEASVRDLFTAVEERLTRLDLLVNNAGAFGPTTPIEETTLADWQATIDVNLTGSWLCARAAFALMKRQVPGGGRIINNGSLSAHVPRPNTAAYAATKHAITGLTKSLSLDGRPYGIACGQIDIGNAATQMIAAASTGLQQADGSLAVEPTMDVAHVGTAVAQMAGLPLSANVQFLTIMATAMPYIGRG